MTIDEVRTFALRLPQTTLDQPFGPHLDVCKVAGKIFVFLELDREPSRLGLKCEPRLARILREQYVDVIPGYHLNKRHWNTVALQGGVPEDEILEMIRHSYDCVVAKLPREPRQAIQQKLVQMESQGEIKQSTFAQ